MLERQAGPDDVRRAFYHLRDANFDNISLDLLHGIPGQSTAELELDIDEALALAPEHVSYYELEAKPGTRFTHAHGAEFARQAEAMEGYFELVIERLIDGRLPLVRDGELLPRARAGRRARPTLTAQPRVLARAGLPRAGHRRGLDARHPSGGETLPASTRTSRRSRAASGRSARSSRSTRESGPRSG